MPEPSMGQTERSSETPEWTFLFELQWWRGEKFIQRFHAWDAGGRIVWDQAWPLFSLQQAFGRLLKAERKARADA